MAVCFGVTKIHCSCLSNSLRLNLLQNSQYCWRMRLCFMQPNSLGAMLLATEQLQHSDIENVTISRHKRVAEIAGNRLGT